MPFTCSTQHCVAQYPTYKVKLTWPDVTASTAIVTVNSKGNIMMQNDQTVACSTVTEEQ